ncbi:polyphosphate kinase 2 [Deltaproteobacteria bacterium TL4]
MSQEKKKTAPKTADPEKKKTTSDSKTKTVKNKNKTVTGKKTTAQIVTSPPQESIEENFDFVESLVEQVPHPLRNPGAKTSSSINARKTKVASPPQAPIEKTASSKGDPQKSPARITPTEIQSNRISRNEYENELAKLHRELVKLQYWVWQQGLRLVIIFEGRDTTERREIIKRVIDPLNTRGATVVALGIPSDVEKTQWYFQRYIRHLPASGEIVLFNRSWYNRCTVERIMKFCTDLQYKEFLRSCPEFERMLVRSGTIVLKYWFSVSFEEYEKRLKERASNPMQRWEISSIALECANRWEDYSKAKDEMFFYTDIKEAPWRSVDADDSSLACLNCIHDILKAVPYEDILPGPLDISPIRPTGDYKRPPREDSFYVENVYQQT